MATLNRRSSGQWQAKIRKKGHPYQSKTFSTKAAAERWARQVETEMEQGIFLSTALAEQTTLSELLARYQKEVLPTKKSQKQVRSSCNLIDRLIGRYTAAALTPAVLAQFRDTRLKKVSPHTVRKDLLLIQRILKHAQREWGIHLPRGNPVQLVTIPKQPRGRDRRLAGDEEQRLLEAAAAYGGEINAVIQLAIETGMRRGEIHRLHWSYIDLNKRTATLLDTKNGEDRTIPLSEKACEVLRGIPRQISGRVFAIRADSITQAFNRICKTAGIEDLRFHDLRHEATSRFFERGLTIMEVSSITGHKDLAMLKRYTHLRAEDLARKLV